MKSFTYDVRVDWTGNDGQGTSSARYGRDNEIATGGKPTIMGSAPREFGGDGVSWAPEDLLVASVSQCHMLTYLFLCSRAGIVVESYHDDATGLLDVEGASGGQFREVVLRPHVEISAGDADKATALHADAHAGCYVGRSVRFPVRVEATTSVKPAG